MLLKGKTAIITGCNRGIGKATMEKFAENGCNIYAFVRTISEEYSSFCEALVKKHNIFIEVLKVDITNSVDLKNAVKKVLDKKVCVDILINNAGIVGSNKSFLMTTIEEQKRIFEINYFAHMAVMQYVLKIMIKNKKGAIVNISSIAGIDGEPAPNEYVSSKAAIIGATKKLSKELSIYNIRVNSVAPGLTNTDMGQMVEGEARAYAMSKIALKRFAEPYEIANSIVFLASDLASYITGQTLRVDGGI